MSIFLISHLERCPAVEVFGALRSSRMLLEAPRDIGADSGIVGAIARLDDVDRPVNPVTCDWL
jgi:hypothetical protein